MGVSRNLGLGTYGNQAVLHAAQTFWATAGFKKSSPRPMARIFGPPVRAAGLSNTGIGFGNHIKLSKRISAIKEQACRLFSFVYEGSL